MCCMECAACLVASWPEMGVILLHTADAFDFACCSSPLAVKTHRRLYVVCVVCLKQHLQSCRLPARISDT